MKIYLAAPFAGRDILKEHLPVWAAAGHEVTCGWVRSTRSLVTEHLGASPISTDDEATEHASMDFADIDASDAVVHYTANYLKTLAPFSDDHHKLHSGGRHVETGYALAKGKPVVIIGDKENIFQRGLCLTAFDIESAIAALDVAFDVGNWWSR